MDNTLSYHVKTPYMLNLQGSWQAFIKLLASKGSQGVFVGLGRQW
jgi:hypothetical protein